MLRMIWHFEVILFQMCVSVCALIYDYWVVKLFILNILCHNVAYLLIFQFMTIKVTTSANSPHIHKCGSSEILKHIADSRKSSKHMCPLWKMKRLLLLRKSGWNSRQVCWRHQRRCVAQQSASNGDVKLGGGIRKYMMPLQPSTKLSMQMLTSII